MQLHPESSPDHSVHAAHGSAIAQISGERVKGWVTSALLGLSVAMNVWLFYEFKNAQTEQRLAQYNLDWFRTHEFAALESRVGVIEKVQPVICKR